MTSPHGIPTSILRQRLARYEDDEAFDAALARVRPASIQWPPPPKGAPKAVQIAPASQTASANELRPRALADVIGQARLKSLLRRLIDAAKSTGRPLDHLLFVGAAGSGKTTLAGVIANEIGTRVFELKAPLSTDVLLALKGSARDRDVVFVDEIHMQVSGDRRGITQACDPESFYLLLEDRLLATPTGPVKFPQVTWIGATTDVGLLPQPLSDRFTLQPRLSAYTTGDLVQIAQANAQALDVRCDESVCAMFAGASRGVPRVVNNYIRAARQLGGESVTNSLAHEVVVDLFSTTLDGLTDSMQTVLTYLYRFCGRERKGEMVYSASVNNLATAAGHGRDTKAISLLVEPYLLQQGLLQVRPTGRVLTPRGVERAGQLVNGG